MDSFIPSFNKHLLKAYHVPITFRYWEHRNESKLCLLKTFILVGRKTDEVRICYEEELSMEIVITGWLLGIQGITAFFLIR